MWIRHVLEETEDCQQDDKAKLKIIQTIRDLNSMVSPSHGDSDLENLADSSHLHGIYLAIIFFCTTIVSGCMF